MTNMPNAGAAINCEPQENCPFCGSSGRVLFEGLTDRIFCCVEGTWREMECANNDCQSLWIDPRPFEQELFKAYARYYTHAAGNDDYAPQPFVQIKHHAFRLATSVIKRFYGQRAERAQLKLLYLPAGQGRHLLEVGCGGGERLQLLTRHGWVVEGQDVDPKAAANARNKYGVPVHCGKLEELTLPPSSFDALVLNHVIEHVSDPASLLRSCHTLLKPGGILAMATPNATSFGLATFGAAWMALDVPRHLQVFSMKSIEQLVSRAGFKEIRTWTSAANASRVAAGSLAILRKGRFAVDREIGDDIRWEAMRFQKKAIARQRKDPDSGDDILIHATR